MRVLVTFAVEAEFAPWRKLRNFEETKTSDVTVARAQIGRASTDFVVTGMGVDNAFRVAHSALAEQYQFCVTAGFAGSLKEEHLVGQVLVADTVQLLDKAKTLQCGTGLVLAARDDGAKRVKMFLTSDHVVRTTEEKRRLAPLADAVEMESFGVLAAAKERARPAVAIRVITDDLRNDMPAIVEKAVDEKGRIRMGDVVRHLGRHPLQLPALIRLGRDSKTAAEALANFLEAFITKLSFTSHGRTPEELREVAAQ